ncbi:hypothetical protein EDE12_1205 [Methylosinus sp. sav-2]|jgi:putative transcriptional regulator|uniref:helix-turn-helix transcriptional regulator n=1 Tax=unclassified Methylosinus TaxID=2624500 RepID=UPI0004B5A06F|nr:MULTISPECIES: helix-turn-helix transcriptional regulator [unclassified Methylosinus]TDX60481.1 hypothetical protein EDE12_1205 [Methylosinus sp. sav-2]
MSAFGKELIQSLGEALAHVKGDGPAVVHVPVDPREIRKHAGLTQAEMAPLMGMSLSGYPEMGTGPARGQRPGRNAVTRDRDGAGSGEKGARGVTFEQTSRVR